jgi:hypothetical protein
MEESRVNLPRPKARNKRMRSWIQILNLILVEVGARVLIFGEATRSESETRARRYVYCVAIRRIRACLTESGYQR